MGSELAEIRIVVVGRVQGVGYRAWFARLAAERRIGGFVRNRADGSVEAMLTGPSAAVEALIELARQGPPAAEVRSLRREPAGAAADAPPGGRFEILPTV